MTSLPMPSSWHREVMTILNSLRRFKLPNQDPLRNHVPMGFLQKDENQGWELFEDLAEKTIQWELTLENSRNTNPISTKGGIHFH